MESCRRGARAAPVLVLFLLCMRVEVVRRIVLLLDFFTRWANPCLTPVLARTNDDFYYLETILCGNDWQQKNETARSLIFFLFTIGNEH